MAKRYGVMIFLLGGVLLLASCGQPKSIADIFLDYQQRLARVFLLSDEASDELNALQPINRQMLEYPSRRALLRDIPPLNISLLELLRLSQCEINRLISEHNTSLNKFQGSEEELFYDLEFIRLVDACIATRSADSELTQKLIYAKAHKSQGLKARVHNAIFTSPEAVYYFSVAAVLPPIAVEDDAIYAVAHSLQNISAILQSVWAYQQGERATLMPQKKAFNEALGQLALSKRAGQWLLAMQLSTQQMQQIEKTLNAELIAKTCKKTSTGKVLLKGDKKQALEYLFRAVYIAQLQREFVHLKKAIEINRTLAPLIPSAEISQALHTYWQATWAEQPSSVSEQFLTAIIDHSRFWQRLLAACDILHLPPIKN